MKLKFQKYRNKWQFPATQLEWKLELKFSLCQDNI